MIWKFLIDFINVHSLVYVYIILQLKLYIPLNRLQLSLLPFCNDDSMHTLRIIMLDIVCKNKNKQIASCKVY